MPTRFTSIRFASVGDLIPFGSRQEAKEYLTKERLECLLCGKAFANLTNHLRQTHSISGAEYKAQLRLPKTRGLVGTRTRLRYSKNGKSKSIPMDARMRGLEAAKKSHAGVSSFAMFHQTQFVKRMSLLRKKIGARTILRVLRNTMPCDTLAAAARRAGVNYWTAIHYFGKPSAAKAAFDELSRW